MAIIDVHRTWAKVEERLETETDPVLRRNLETVLAHMKAEAEGDIDGLLVTLADDVAYHAYGTDDPMLPAWSRARTVNVVVWTRVGTPVTAVVRDSRRASPANRSPSGTVPFTSDHRYGVPWPQHASMNPA